MPESTISEGMASPLGESMTMSMSWAEPVTLERVNELFLPTAVAASDWPETRIRFGSEKRGAVGFAISKLLKSLLVPV